MSTNARNTARSELAQYLKGTRYEIADPLEDTRSLAERELDAQRDITLLHMLEPKGFAFVTRDDGRRMRIARTRTNVRWSIALEAEFRRCPRCNLVRTGECVDITSGLTGNALRVHLACVENGDELR